MAINKKKSSKKSTILEIREKIYKLILIRNIISVSFIFLGVLFAINTYKSNYTMIIPLIIMISTLLILILFLVEHKISLLKSLVAPDKRKHI